MAAPRGSVGGGDEEAEADLWLSDLQEDNLEPYVWHFDMLHHGARNDAYQNAFKRLPEAVVAGGPDRPVLDIGCGSGLLGLMLRRHCPGAAAGSGPHVLAIEADKKLAKVARGNVARAGCELQVRVQARVSSAVSLPAGARSPLAVHELFDSALLGEAVLPTLRDAASRLLCPGYMSVPSRVQVSGVLVESAFLRSFQRLRHGIGGHQARVPAAWRADPGDPRPHEVNLTRLIESGQCRRLSADFDALQIDLENLPSRRGQQATFRVTVKDGGEAEAIVFWWRCAMLRGDSFGDGGISNAPGAAGDPDHWRQAFCVLPPSGGRGRQVSRGDVLRITACHNDEQVWFDVERDCADGDRGGLPPSLATPTLRQPLRPDAGCASPMRLLSPWRLRLLQDPRRLAVLRRRLRRGLLEARSRQLLSRPGWGGLAVLDTTDGGHLALLHCSQRGRAAAVIRSAQRALRACGGPAAASGLVRLRILKAKRRRKAAAAVGVLWALGDRAGREAGADLAAASASGLRPSFRRSSWQPPASSVDVLVAEPHDGSVEQRQGDLQLWQHWALVRDLLPSLRPAAVVAPRRFRVCAALLSAAPLWRRRERLAGRTFNGVDVGCMESLASPTHFPWAAPSGGAGEGREGRAGFPMDLWQQEHAVFHDEGGDSRTRCPATAVVLFDVDVVSDRLRPLSSGRLLLALPAGTPAAAAAHSLGVHGIVTWVEVAEPATASSNLGDAAGGVWRNTAPMRARGRECPALVFSPSATKQGVLLSRNPLWGIAASPTSVAPASAPAVEVQVAAHFDPARGEVRLDAHWVAPQTGAATGPF